MLHEFINHPMKFCCLIIFFNNIPYIVSLNTTRVWLFLRSCIFSLVTFCWFKWLQITTCTIMGSNRMTRRTSGLNKKESLFVGRTWFYDKRFQEKRQVKRICLLGWSKQHISFLSLSFLCILEFGFLIFLIFVHVNNMNDQTEVVVGLFAF